MEQDRNVTRQYHGNAPGQGWECVHAELSDGVWWYLYRKDDIADGWWNFKLVAGAKVANKANYWFGWNGKRTNRSKDWGVLAVNRPGLQATVLGYLKQELDI